jgi:hypothetical protein
MPGHLYPVISCLPFPRTPPQITKYLCPEGIKEHSTACKKIGETPQSASKPGIGTGLDVET